MDSPPTTPVRSRWNPLNIALWTAQGVLALFYAEVGVLMATQSMEALAAAGMEVTIDDPALLTRFIGTMELLGAVGILLPALTGILPRLTPLAALGLSTIQVLAILFHHARGELGGSWPVNLALLASSLFVLWGRIRRAPIRARFRPPR